MELCKAAEATFQLFNDPDWAAKLEPQVEKHAKYYKPIAEANFSEHWKSLIVKPINTS